MNKQELIEAIAKKTEHSSAESSKYLGAMIEAIEEDLKRGEEIRVTGFGKFSVRQRVTREGRNPQTGQSMTIPASKTPGFSAGNSLKNAI